MNYQQILDRVSKWPKAVAAVEKAREDMAYGAPHWLRMEDIAMVAAYALHRRDSDEGFGLTCRESDVLNHALGFPHRARDIFQHMVSEGLIVRQGETDWYDLSPILDALGVKPHDWNWRADPGQDHISADPKHPRLKGHGEHSIEMRVDGLGRPVLKVWADLVRQHSATCRSFADAFKFLDECEAEAVAQIEAEEPDEYDKAAQEEQDMREMHEEDRAREQAAVEEGGVS